MTEWDVVRVAFTTNQVKVLAGPRDKWQAEAVLKMAVLRTGVEYQFFARVPHGRYQDGDEWKGAEDEVVAGTVEESMAI